MKSSANQGLRTSIALSITQLLSRKSTAGRWFFLVYYQTQDPFVLALIERRHKIIQADLYSRSRLALLVSKRWVLVGFCFFVRMKMV